MNDAARRGVPEWLVTACGVWEVGLGLYFLLLRPALLPEDLRYMGVDAQALQAAVPGLAAWLRHVFTVMGCFMAGAGVLAAFFGWCVMPMRLRGSTAVLALAGLFTVVLMSAVNFALHSDFRWLLLVPALAWAAAVLGCIRRRTP
jgi:hypothetical protein